jgi:DNA-binding CsgD family transcriptional regulator/PAS domain-containing protein
VLDTARRFIGGMSGTIFAKDERSARSGIFHIDSNIDFDYGKSYFDRYEKVDSGDGWTRLPGIDQAAGMMDLLDADEMARSRFYRDWARPAGIVDLVMAPLERAGGITALFGVFLHERDGMADDGIKRRMHLLTPHVRRALSIGKDIDRQAQQTMSLSDAFDGLAAGLFLIDAAGRVVHTNRAARAMLGSGALALRDDRIAVSDRDTRRTLADAFTAVADRDGTMARGGVSLTLAGDDGDYVAHVLPLTSGARAATGGHYAAVTALFVQPLSQELPLSAEMARTFGLTAAEQRVLSAIVNIGGVPETSETLGIAESTVKTHLHRVFDKTGTSRQADLVKLLAGYASPLGR